MRKLYHVIAFDFKSMWRSNTIKAIVLVVFGAGVYGIYFGKFEIDKQEERILEVQEYERQQFDSLLIWSALDPTKPENETLYQKAVSPTGVGRSKHFTYYLSKETPAGAGLCLGQRDLFPVYYSFNMGDLARQVNTGELANPMKLLSGNFDLSYVIVFLFPLLIIGLFYNLYASEKEGGTLLLLQSQSASIRTILISRGLLRLILVWGLATILLSIGFIIQGISISNQFPLFLKWLGILYSYSLLWALLMGGIVGLRRSASLSAMLGLGVWLAFTIVSPALLNLLVIAKEPLPNRAEMLHKIRTLNNDIWENSKSFVNNEFYRDHPEYAKGDTSDFNQWYYAGFTLIDKEAKALKAQYEEQVRKRNRLIERWQWLAPAALVHEKLSVLSKTDRQSHMHFVEELHDYHNELRQLYYARIFNKENFSPEDLARINEML